MSIAFQLVKPRQHEANPELYHICTYLLIQIKKNSLIY
jgi:hypothetical protein